MTAQFRNTPRSISAVELGERLRRGEPLELIDVRTPAEFGAVHATIARSVPLANLNAAAVIASRQRPGEPLYVICRSGARGAQACAAFAAAGHGDLVVNVEGGTLAWEQAGLPVERGRAVMPLDRQVRIVIGSLVVLGAILGYTVHPAFHLVSGFCGAGLVFAGVTDFCPMARTISLMPWNQVTGRAKEAAGGA